MMQYIQMWTALNQRMTSEYNFLLGIASLESLHFVTVSTSLTV